MALVAASCFCLHHRGLPSFRPVHPLRRFNLCLKPHLLGAPSPILTARASMDPQSNSTPFVTTFDLVQHSVNISSRWIITAIVAVVVAWRHDDPVFWAMTGSILNAASSKLLKRLFNQERPSTALGLKSDPGMPSSHAQSFAFLSLYASISLMQGSFISIALSVMVILSGLYLAWLRVSRGLHTPKQVVVGLGFGYCMAGVWIGLWHYLVKDIVATFIIFHYLLVCLGGLSSLCFLMFGIRKWKFGDA